MRKGVDARGLRIERRFKPVEDLQDATPDHMEKRVRDTVQLARRHDVGALCLRTSGIQPWQNVQADIEKVRQWIGIARRVVEDELHMGEVPIPLCRF